MKYQKTKNKKHWFMKYLQTIFKGKEKNLIILKAFYIFYKNYVKTFLKQLIN